MIIKRMCATSRHITSVASHISDQTMSMTTRQCDATDYARIVRPHGGTATHLNGPSHALQCSAPSRATAVSTRSHCSLTHHARQWGAQSTPCFSSHALHLLALPARLACSPRVLASPARLASSSGLLASPALLACSPARLLASCARLACSSRQLVSSARLVCSPRLLASPARLLAASWPPRLLASRLLASPCARLIPARLACSSRQLVSPAHLTSRPPHRSTRQLGRPARPIRCLACSSRLAAPRRAAAISSSPPPWTGVIAIIASREPQVVPL